MFLTSFNTFSSNSRHISDSSLFCVQLCTEKHQAERKKWLEEKLSLIGQAKEAEDKRNQDMRKFVEDRERYNRQQSQLVRKGWRPRPPPAPK